MPHLGNKKLPKWVKDNFDVQDLKRADASAFVTKAGWHVEIIAAKKEKNEKPVLTEEELQGLPHPRIKMAKCNAGICIIDILHGRICGQVYPTNGELGRHMKTAHPGVVDNGHRSNATKEDEILGNYAIFAYIATGEYQAVKIKLTANDIE
ncbi:hypothetical protein MCOR09_002508 [Pyricularia oryzae]|nr:hypothetical protein MCOR09_002508 [Pyricularia oryzae]